MPPEEESIIQQQEKEQRRCSSSHNDFTLYEIHHDEIIDCHYHGDALQEQSENALQGGDLFVYAETEKHLKDHMLLNDDGVFKCTNWDGKLLYSDYIKAGIEYKRQKDPSYIPHNDVVMLFESPSSSATDSSFHFRNSSKYLFHDWPPPKCSRSKAILGSCRYAGMNGNAFPVFIRDGTPPEGLVDHWARTLPGFRIPNFVDTIDTTDQNSTVYYAYLPVEQLKKHHHVNDPDTHFHLAGKDAIHLMTQKTTQLLPDTRTKRPCVVKTTHSMGSRGIFIISNDDDEMEFQQFLIDSGNPPYVVVDFVDISRNVACHFFIHPNGSIVWMGSNENHREGPEGKFSSDSYLIMDDQETLKELQLPFVEEVVRYCHAMNFWGFCGIDVLFDSTGNGYLVDINPRVTGSCPALMTLTKFHQMEECGFQVGLFRREGDINYFGPAKQLLEEVNEYNELHKGESIVVIHSFVEQQRNNGIDDGATAGTEKAGAVDDAVATKVNIGVYGHNLGECKEVLNRFARPDQ